MADVDKNTADEIHRLREHEAIKDQMRGDVHREMAAHTEAAADERVEVADAARELKRKAVSEVSQTEAEIDRGRTAARVSQVVDYAFYVIYGLIGLEIALELLGARDASGFKRFLDTITAPLLAPFRGLMADPAVGSFRLMISFVVGLVVYMLIHMAIKGLLRLTAQRRTSI